MTTPLHRRSSTLLAAAITAAASLGAPATALAAHGVTSPISLDPFGLIGNDASLYADMTPDGRFVAFASVASNLVPGDTNGVGDVFVRDRRTGVTERVSIGTRGAEGDGDSQFLGVASDPSISADGRYVAFESEATNLVKGDRNGVADVFVHDRRDGTTERVSVDDAGQEVPGGADQPAISPDGRYVAFVGNLDGDFTDEVSLRDRVAGTTVAVSVTDAGLTTSGSEPSVGLLPGGPIVAFSSGAQLVPEDDDSNVDVFVRDLAAATPTTARVSVSSDEQPAGEFSSSRSPAISGDGTRVAFQSSAKNLTSPAQTGNFADVFVRDLAAGTTTLASPDTDGGEADGSSEEPEISADGRFVSFGSFASDLVANKTDNSLLRDVYVRDLQAGSTELVSVASDHTDARFGVSDTHVEPGPVSADGLVTLLTTNADNLFAGDDNRSQDVYANDRRAGTDLSLTMEDGPDPIAPKNTLVYTLVATNHGENPALAAGIVDALPEGVTFAQASEGCTLLDERTVDCDLGTIPAGESTTVTIEVTTKSTGVFTNSATLGALTPDSDASNNTASVETTVAK